MPRKFIKRYIPDQNKLKEQKSLRLFGELLLSQNLWHLNKRSVSGAFSVGLFCAFIPIPFQMLLAAGLALLFRVNLPLSIALVWITNPLTMPPIFYACYLVGAWLMGIPATNFEFELSSEWFSNGLANTWKPFLLGCGVMAIVGAILGNIAARLLWRLMVVRNWKKRYEARKAKQN
jgi:uncharacterized protein (DUF2062 family)